MPSMNAEHQFNVIQTEFISPEKANFTSVTKPTPFVERRSLSVSLDWITA
jgi:hypothetical protein